MVETVENTICLNEQFLKEISTILPPLDYRLHLIHEMDFLAFYENVIWFEYTKSKAKKDNCND